MLKRLARRNIDAKNHYIFRSRFKPKLVIGIEKFQNDHCSNLQRGRSRSFEIFSEKESVIFSSKDNESVLCVDIFSLSHRKAKSLHCVLSSVQFI